jgi:hypothetical protein
MMVVNEERFWMIVVKNLGSRLEVGWRRMVGLEAGDMEGVRTRECLRYLELVRSS